MPPPTDPDPAADGDPTRWSRILAGDYDYLVRRFWEPVRRYLSRRLRSPEEAEELTQDVFLAFVERDLLARPSRDRGAFRRFLYHVAGQFLIDRYRAADARREGRKVSLDATSAQVPAAEEDPGVEFDRAFYLSILQRAREKVREEYEERGRPEAWEAFRLLYYGDESGTRPTQEEIGRRLGLTPDQVRNVSHRGKSVFARAVRESIQEYVGSVRELEEELASFSSFLESHRLEG